MLQIINRIKRKLYKLSHPVQGTILMLHRVVNKRSSLVANKNIEITPQFLEQTIKAYLTKGYRFVDLDEVHKQLSGSLKSKNKFVCFTLDDGYRDNYEVAYPIFKKYNCPFTVYVSTDFPDNKAVVWWYVLDDIIMNNDKLVLSDGSEYFCGNIEEKDSTFYAIHKKISGVKPELLKQTFLDWFSAYEFSFEQKVGDLSLTNEQIKLLAEDNLCTIASHTVTHPRLADMTIEQQRFELTESKIKLESLIRKDVHHFSYPFGNHNADTISLAQECGYKTATFAWGGHTRKGQTAWTLTREILSE